MGVSRFRKRGDFILLNPQLHVRKSYRLGITTPAMASFYVLQLLVPPSIGWGGPNRDWRNGFSVENGRAGICGSYSPQPTLVHLKPVEKHGSEVTYRLVVTSALVVIPFRSLLVS
jgi:hypothetical protein